MPQSATVRQDLQAEYRRLPAVDAVLRQPPVLLLAAEYGEAAVTESVRAVLAAARAAIAAGEGAPPAAALPSLVQAHLTAGDAPSLRNVINATGVIIHTNLGRAPLSEAALAAIQAVAAAYSNLEYDLAGGTRGSRHDHARRVLCELTGAEDALIVNNNAAAVYLILAALFCERGVLISRGQLVEIGGGFRIPDVLRQGGAHLVEVGTTNRTHLRDFADGITPETAAIMRVHSSNFRQLGFVTMPSLAELAELAHARGVLLIDDLGSGTLLDTTPYGLAYEPTVQESVAAGADLITFSGDKLLGGPQAGVILGRKPLIEQLRRHPMARALRVDKMTLAALEATLRAYRRGRAATEIPVWRMIAATAGELHARAEKWQAHMQQHGIAAAVWPGESAVGGGSLPGETLPTFLLAIPRRESEAGAAADRAAADRVAPDRELQDGGVAAAAARLRLGSPAVVCRIQKDHLLFDPRTVLPFQEEALLRALVAHLGTG
jgi:L-seryl-tRNA(Ser) seleniumtransferase